MTSRAASRNPVTIISPHFDDVPLSLGQSLRDGVLSGCSVHVRVAFGTTNWTNVVHPTVGRTKYVSLWRRGEETVASLLFGYRWTAAGWPEVQLRVGATGLLESDQMLDTDSDVRSDPLTGEVADWLARVVEPRSGPKPSLLLVCAGLGGHIDHRIVANAAAGLVGEVGCPVGFYEDRPYAAYLDEAERDRQLAGLGLDLVPFDFSGQVSRSTQMRARSCYPSQMVRYFEQAMDLDRSVAARERVWFPRGVELDPALRLPS